MFVLGLVVGPAIALLLYHALVHSGKVALRTFMGASLFVVVLLLLSEFSKLELRLGLAFGILLGLLLAITPFQLSSFEDSEARLTD
jgi:hypothetical protein